jgi:hypothetical protein
MRHLLSTTILLSSLCVAHAAVAQTDLRNEDIEQEVMHTLDGAKFKVSTGFDYSKGDYGQSQDTEIWYVPLTGKVEVNQWTAKVTVPYLTIKGPGAVAGDTLIGTGGTVVTTESGLGDVVGSLAYTVDLPQTTYLDITSKVKLPTANEKKGLGTGEADYTLQADLTKQLGSFVVFGGAGYKIVGSNSSLNLDNVWLVNLGAGYTVDKQTSVGLMYDWREAASQSSENPSEATAYVNYKFTKSFNMQVYGVTGFTDGSANLGGGMMLGYKF